MKPSDKARCKKLDDEKALLQEYYDANEDCANGNFELKNLDRLDAARAALDNGGIVRENQIGKPMGLGSALRLATDAL